MISSRKYFAILLWTDSWRHRLTVCVQISCKLCTGKWVKRFVVFMARSLENAVFRCRSAPNFAGERTVENKKSGRLGVSLHGRGATSPAAGATDSGSGRAAAPAQAATFRWVPGWRSPGGRPSKVRRVWDRWSATGSQRHTIHSLLCPSSIAAKSGTSGYGKRVRGSRLVTGIGSLCCECQTVRRKWHCAVYVILTVVMCSSHDEHWVRYIFPSFNKLLNSEQLFQFLNSTQVQVQWQPLRNTRRINSIIPLKYFQVPTLPN